MENTLIISIISLLLSKYAVVGLRCQIHNQTYRGYDYCLKGKSNAYCYAKWYNHTHTNTLDIRIKGCKYEQDCFEITVECISRNIFNGPTFFHDCCCDADSCNSKIKWEPDPINTEANDNFTIQKVLVETVFYLILLLAMYVAYKLYRSRFINNSNSQDRPSVDPPAIELNEVPLLVEETSRDRGVIRNVSSHVAETQFADTPVG